METKTRGRPRGIEKEVIKLRVPKESRERLVEYFKAHPFVTSESVNEFLGGVLKGGSITPLDIGVGPVEKAGPDISELKENIRLLLEDVARLEEDNRNLTQLHENAMAASDEDKVRYWRDRYFSIAPKRKEFDQEES